MMETPFVIPFRWSASCWYVTSIVTTCMLWCIIIVVFLVLMIISIGCVIPNVCANYHTSKFLYQCDRFFCLSFWIVLLYGLFLLIKVFLTLQLYFGGQLKARWPFFLHFMQMECFTHWGIDGGLLSCLSLHNASVCTTL